MQGLGDAALKHRGPFLLLVGGAGLVIEVTLTFDVGVLEAVGPAANLARAAFGQGAEIGNLRFQMFKFGKSVKEWSMERTSPAEPRAMSR
jgi:hypothetical protein